LLESIRYCQTEKDLEIYAWRIMPSHVRLTISSRQNPLANIIRDLKSFTSRKLRQVISDNGSESRRD